MPTLKQIHEGKLARTYERPPRPGAFKRAAIETGMVGLRGLEGVVDILERPAISLSEAYGDITEGEEGGESTFDAWWRGLTEGREKKKYPTFAERIVPEEEGEGFGRKAVRFGAELATDPTSYFGVGLAKGLGGKALAPIARGARAIAATDLMQTVGHSAAAQSFSRMVVPAMNHIAYHGGAAGKAITVGFDVADRARRKKVQPFIRRFDQEVKRLGLAGRKNEQRRKAVRHVIEGTLDQELPSGITREMINDPAVRELASVTRRGLDAIGEEIEGFRYLGEGATKGSGFTMKMDDGSVRPFSMLENYFPDMLAEKPMQDLVGSAKARKVAENLSSAGAKRQAEELAKKHGITLGQATELQRRYSGQAVRFGNIEMPRKSRTPVKIREDDVAKVFTRYADESFRRLEFSREFGVGLERLTGDVVKGKRTPGLFQQAEDFGLSGKTIQDVTEVIRGIAPESFLGVQKLAPYVMAFQVLTKLGPTSTLSNLSQQTNIIVREGVSNYIRGLVKLARDEGVRTRSLDAVESGIRNQVQDLIGEHTDNWASQAATKWLGGVGFNLAEQANRRVGYAGGVASIEQALKRAIKKAGPGASPADILKADPTLARAMGTIKAHDVNFYRATGKLSNAAEKRVGFEAAEATQFTTNYLDLPSAHRSPEMKIAMQFKNFVYQQTRFLMRDVMSPAATWMESGGQRGTIQPLMRAMVMYPAAGASVAAIREVYAEKVANTLGVERRFGRKVDEDHPVWQLVQDSLYVGSMGMAGDMLEQAKRGNLMEWAAGPTGADIGVILGGLEKLSQGKPVDPVSAATKFIPGRRAIPLAPTEVGRKIQEMRARLKRRSRPARQNLQKPELFR